MLSITGSYILLGIIAAVFIGFSVMIALYQLIYWADKQEVWKTIFPRIIIIISIFLTIFTPLLIPFDAAVSFLTPRATFMTLVWQIFVYINMIFAFIILPYLFFIQDIRIEEKVNCFKQYSFAFIQLLILLTIIFAITIILFYTIGNADIPTIMIDSATIGDQTGYIENLVKSTNIIMGASVKTTIVLPLNFQTYLFAIVSFLGSIMFIIFLGVGTAALPIDLIKKFIRRPKAMSTQQLIKFKKEYITKAQRILTKIDTLYLRLTINTPRSVVLRELRYGSDKNLFSNNKKLLKAAIILERQAQELYQSYSEIIAMNQKDSANPLKYYFSLVLGILCAIGSFVMAAQYIMVLIYQFAPQVFKHDRTIAFFLSELCYLAQVGIGVPLISSIIFAIVAFFVIFCYLKGVTKFGFRFILFVSIHPMQKGLTQISSFLFNASIMLIGILASLQFFTTVFSSFTYGSAAGILFNVGVSNIQYLRYWFHFQYAVLCCVMVISFILCIFLKPKQIDSDIEDMINNKTEKKAKRKNKIEMRSSKV
ncbi:LMBR1-like membrane protein [Spironucleus salmonicida]|uniref:LMBR1-like membrane protein n=1 Tax=Spironucleus salmonicida TaxID=348837 RepID=V6LJ83_9EUKA|nr:LMBR1-like membrane protein [Spironucleus salmonicida]|eukprot:EST43746.1 LMBR1-like membrane protein [Spironucleus salmonicida]